MRFLAAVAVLAFAASPAAADRKARAKPAKAPAAATTDANPVCKRVVVGRGLDRKVVCEFVAPIDVKATPPGPAVVVAPRDGRSVVGRPRVTDPFAGLSPRLR